MAGGGHAQDGYCEHGVDEGACDICNPPYSRAAQEQFDRWANRLVFWFFLLMIGGCFYCQLRSV